MQECGSDQPVDLPLLYQCAFSSSEIYEDLGLHLKYFLMFSRDALSETDNVERPHDKK